MASLAAATAGVALDDAEIDDTPRRKREIAQTAARLFNRFGFKRVSVEEICRQAGASKATFYKYFPNKTELVKDIFQRMSDNAERKLAAVERMDAPFIDKVRLLIDDRIEQAARTGDAFIEDFYGADDELSQFIDAMLEENQNRFLEFIADGQKRGNVRPGIRLAFVKAMLEKLHELASDQELRLHYPNFEATSREIVDFFFFGILES